MALSYVPVVGTTTPSFGDTTVNGTLTVAGATELNDDLTVTGITTVADLNISGTTTNMVNLSAAQIDATKLSIDDQPASVEAISVRVTNDANARYSITNEGAVSWGPGNAVADTHLTRSGVNTLNTPGTITMGAASTGSAQITAATASALDISTAGGGIAIKGGTNARAGTATLTLGSATVANTSVTDDDIIMLTVQQIGTVSQPKAMTISSLTPGASFQIVSEDATDTSTVAWFIVRVTP